jgi:O-antigen ligase
MEPKILINSIKIGIFATLLTPFIVGMNFYFNFYFPFVGPKSLYFMAVAEIIFFLWVILAWRWEQYRPNIKNPVIAAVLIFLGVLFVSGIAGANFSASFWSKFERMDGILMFCHLVALTLVISTVFDKKDWIRFFCASVGVAALVGLRALFDQSATSRGGGTIGNDSFWGTYILFNIFFAAYLFLSSKGEDKKIKIFSAAAFIILVACLLLEGSVFWSGVVGAKSSLPQTALWIDLINNGPRAAKLSFLAGIGLFGILFLARRQKAAIKTVLISLFVAAAALVILVFAHKDAVYQKLVELTNEGTVRSRLVVWNIAWKGFLERPYLGWGPENFSLPFARHYDPCLGSLPCGMDIWYDRAHNIVFDLLAETGIAGLAAYLAIFGAVFYVLWKGFFSDKVGFAEMGIFSALFGAYFLQNLTVFDMVVSYLMWFVSLGFIASLADQKTTRENIFSRPLTWPQSVFPVAAALICLCVFVLGPLTSDYDTVQAAGAPFGSPKRLQLYRETLEASPMGKYQIQSFFAQQWLAAMGNKEIVNRLNQQAAEAEFSYLSGELEKSCTEFPQDLQLRLELSRLYNSWSRFEKSKIPLAESSLEKALQISPKNQQVYWELAQTRLNQKRIDDAAALVRQAYDLWPRNKNAQRILKELENIKGQAAQTRPEK